MNSGDRFEKWTKAEGTEGILVEALERLARLGNEPHVGNSDGNMIARYALDEYRRLRLNAAEKATAPAGLVEEKTCGTCRNKYSESCEYCKNGLGKIDFSKWQPLSRHAADEPLAMDKRTALALIEYETTRARAVLDGMESENRGRERQGSAHAWPESCFAEVTDELEQKTKEARAYLNGLADKKENI